MDCPACGAVCSWVRVECTPEKTVRYFRCPKCKKSFSREEPAKPAEFFKPGA